MEAALYGAGGFFAGAGTGPAGHFRTSAHASPLFAAALLRLIERVDAGLGHPTPFQVVDVGAGRGELLTTLQALLRSSAPRSTLADRVELCGVEVCRRPARLDAAIRWRREVPDGIVGMLAATEWLDNVPVDVAEVDDAGQVRRVLVDPASGVEALGAAVDAADRFWLARWWAPGGWAGARVEIGWPRDLAWADAVSKVSRGCALAVDYGHLRDERPGLGTLTGFRGGRQVEPVPDGSCDITAHVAMDAVARAAGTPYALIRQRKALKALGVDGGRPPIDLARTDPAGYLRALTGAGAAAELIDPAGLGGHWWLLHAIGVDVAMP